MPAYKVIFRLDFAHPSFEILDKPGTIMRLLNEMGENYWPEFQDNTQERIVSATNNEDGNPRQMVVSPTHLYFSFENKKGIELNKLDSHETYSHLFKGVNQIFENFKIAKINRAGIRVIGLNSLGKDNPKLNSLFEEIFGNEVIKNIGTNLGSVDDIGVKLDGSSADKTKYHLQFGPYAKEEFGRYFKFTAPENLKANFIYDLDVYEEQFSLTVRPSVWPRTILQNAHKTISELEDIFLKKLG